MNRILYVLFLMTSFLGFSQSNIIMEQKITEAQSLSFIDPDSALIMAKKLEPKIHDDKLLSRLLLAKGSAYSVKHLSSTALKFGFEALDVSKRSKDSLMMINSLGFIGNQYYTLNLYKKALNYLSRAETIIGLYKNPSLNQISGNIYSVKGVIYKENINPAFAIIYFDKAIKEYNKSHVRGNIMNSNITRIQKGYLLIDIGKYDEAEKTYLEVIKDSEKYDISEVYYYAKIGLATVYEKKKEFAKATAILLDAEQKNITTGNISMMVEIYDVMSQSYLNQSNAERYLYYSHKLEKNLLTNDDVEMKSFSDMLQKNVQIQHEEFSNDQKKFYLFIILIILSASIPLIYIIRKIVKLKSTNYLQIQNGHSSH